MFGIILKHANYTTDIRIQIINIDDKVQGSSTDPCSIPSVIDSILQNIGVF